MILQNILVYFYQVTGVSTTYQSEIVLGYAIFIIGLILLIIVLSFLLSPQFRFSSEKQSSYECGFEPFGDARLTFDIHFYIIGLLFLIFDLELVFLFPWLFSFSEQLIFFEINFLSMFVFLFLLGFGFVYEWYNNAIVWVPSQTRD